MGIIVAIGGGEMHKGETTAIDKYIVSLAKKVNPKLLFIPTASNDAAGYIKTAKRHFGSLGCEVTSLCLTSGGLTAQKARESILNSDIIYVGGGNTKFMMEVWKEYGVDSCLREAFEKGVVLSGLSAGSICWFLSGHSDSLLDENGEGEHIFVDGLGIIPYIHCPHYDEVGRETFDDMYRGMDRKAIALENCVALAYVDGVYSVVKSDETKKAYLFTADENGGYAKEELSLEMLAEM